MAILGVLDVRIGLIYKDGQPTDQLGLIVLADPTLWPDLLTPGSLIPSSLEGCAVTVVQTEPITFARPLIPTPTPAPVRCPSETMSNTQRNVEILSAVLDRYRDKLHAFHEVFTSGVGLVRRDSILTDQLAIQVMVDFSFVNETDGGQLKIPPTLDGCPVEITRGGRPVPAGQ